EQRRRIGQRDEAEIGLLNFRARTLRECAGREGRVRGGEDRACAGGLQERAPGDARGLHAHRSVFPFHLAWSAQPSGKDRAFLTPTKKPQPESALRRTSPEQRRCLLALRWTTGAAGGRR